MVETILASYGCSYILLGYLEMMDELFSYVDKITEQDMEKVRKEMDKISDNLKQIEKQIKECEEWK